MPQVIIYDKDMIFTSTLWKELFKLTDTKLNMSPSYHPQTDGQTEHVNQCLGKYLRCLMHAWPSKWSKWISLVEYRYNTTLHWGLNTSPFQVLMATPLITLANSCGCIHGVHSSGMAQWKVSHDWNHPATSTACSTSHEDIRRQASSWVRILCGRLI